MKLRKWLRDAWHDAARKAEGSLLRQRPDDVPDWAGPAAGYSAAGSLWRGLTGRDMELAEMQAEVAAEGRGQILMIAQCDDVNRRLLAHLRGEPPVPQAGPVYREGFFTLLTLPANVAPGEREPLDRDRFSWADLAGRLPDEELDLAGEADLALYVYRRTEGWLAEDARWYARLRSTGVPLVLVEVDDRSDGALDGGASEGGALQCAAIPASFVSSRNGSGPGRAKVSLPAGARPVRIRLTYLRGDSAASVDGAVTAGSEPGAGRASLSNEDGEMSSDVAALVERMLAQRPRLGIPLAQEIAGCRPMIAGRAIRSCMLMTALLGAEPIPLLDLPLQVATNWKMALQLAAIHGHPGLDYHSREMVGTVAWSLSLRYVIQQVVKLVPLLGWAASAALSAGGAWLLGNALCRYYRVQEGAASPAEDVRQAEASLRDHAVGRAQTATVRTLRRARAFLATAPALPSLAAWQRRVHPSAVSHDSSAVAGSAQLTEHVRGVVPPLVGIAHHAAGLRSRLARGDGLAASHEAQEAETGGDDV
jgi:uncharacterized protein (DUF697 family)